MALEFLLGLSTHNALLAASRDQNTYKQRNQLCGAHFFIGQRKLLEGDLQQAKGSFRQAIESGASSCAEFVAARVELEHLGAIPLKMLTMVVDHGIS